MSSLPASVDIKDIDHGPCAPATQTRHAQPEPHVEPDILLSETESQLICEDADL
jgi:hypothetical protein